MSPWLYLGLGGLGFAAAVAFPLAIPRRYALLLAPVILVPPALFIMIQWRCRTTSYHHCGWMSFEGGVTWQFWVALALLAAGFVALALAFSWARHTQPRPELRNFLHAGRMLAGLWAYVVWAALPRAIIHPPNYGGGSCPQIPLVCHDVPLLGIGGGRWLTMPFVLAAAWGLGRYVRDRLNTRMKTS